MFLSSTATYVRFFSKTRSSNLRKINPKVPPQEAMGIAKGLYGIIKDHGPVTVSNTWNIAKDAGISSLNSKPHQKIMLKWMRGRKLLKLFCTHVGSNKKFLHSVLAKESPSAKSNASSVLTVETAKPSRR